MPKWHFSPQFWHKHKKRHFTCFDCPYMTTTQMYTRMCTQCLPIFTHLRTSKWHVDMPLNQRSRFADMSIFMVFTQKPWKYVIFAIWPKIACKNHFFRYPGFDVFLTCPKSMYAHMTRIPFQNPPGTLPKPEKHVFTCF